ncbi:MAG: hypothetical protein U5K55_10770 [Aliarcobacter sp.]|nr:hypothetical protein [Aliarcobacter sp.]
MSQEEIEALMSGLDIEDDEADSEESNESVKVNTQEIEELLSQTEDYKKEDTKAKVKNIEDSKVSFDESKEILENKEESFVKTDEIEKLLNDIESSSLKEDESEEEIFDEFENLEAFDKEPEVEALKVEVKEKDIPVKQNFRSDDDIAKDWTSSKIEEGIFPLPAEKDTKVVSQLTQVANDSEEKVSQIFDVLSLSLDNNNELRSKIKNIEAFVVAQSKLLDSLNKRFPNINVFSEHLNSANDVSNSLNSLKLLTNEEDSQIFQAMELMQFNDINRQKIERVMSVIRKLSLYLNNLFEDDGNSKNVAVAKHIHGDSSDDLIGDDLDKLIAEFSNNK